MVCHLSLNFRNLIDAQSEQSGACALFPYIQTPMGIQMEEVILCYRAVHMSPKYLFVIQSFECQFILCKLLSC